MHPHVSSPALFALLASSLVACGQSPAPRTPTGTCVLDVGDSPVRGPTDALVTVVEFADFMCPYCKMVAPTLEQLENEYPDDVRVVFKNFPLSFHENAFSAAEAGWCASEQGKFWEMYDLLFEKQPAFQDSELAAYADQLGLDASAFADCMAASATSARIQADVALADASGVVALPYVLVNGERIVGAKPIQDYRDAVDAALATARASGIAPADYYASLLQGGCNTSP